MKHVPALQCQAAITKVFNLISDVLGLAHGGEVEGVKYDSLDRFLLYTSPVYLVRPNED